MYTYYIKHTGEERYPFAREIAQKLFDEYGLCNAEQQPLSSFIGAWCSTFEDEEICFEARHGLRRVYKNYKGAIQALFDILGDSTIGEGQTEINIDKRKYTIYQKKDEDGDIA